MSEEPNLKSPEVMITSEKVRQPRVLKHDSDVIPVVVKIQKDGQAHGLTLVRYPCPLIDTYGIFIEASRFEELSKFDQIMEVDNMSTEGKTKQKATSMIRDCWESAGNPVLTLKIHKAKELPIPIKFDFAKESEKTEIHLSPVKKARTTANKTQKN